ncbi:GntR family transcriptional regulator [Pseudoroseicyclus sp. CXY001]|uniref:GntR family transcriptional regulator n=1 Tax=Pseudoroseicyclus sp. CXY001 TaxID=3242492 RepID=UPI00358DA157
MARSTTPVGFRAIEAQPLHEQVQAEIMRAIMSGQVAPGQKLTSRKVAKELGTSDMPVRSAFARLQALRALNAMPNGSMQVPEISIAEFAQLMGLRELLEARATALAAPNIDGNNLRAIRSRCDKLTEAAREGEIGAYLSRNHDFKFSIYRHCGDPQLEFFIETLWLRVGPFLRNFGASFEGELSAILEIDYHEEAVKALEAGDGAAAAEAIARDIREGAAHLIARAKG